MTDISWTLLYGTILLAMLLDWLWGEPAVLFHPVVWMGSYLSWIAKKIAPREIEKSTYEKSRSFLQGTFFWILGGAATTYLAWLIQRFMIVSPWWLAVGISGFCLNTLFSLKLLINEVALVDEALSHSVNAGRSQLKRLVSRDVSNLSEVQIRESAIESLAENLNDSFVAPIFWFLLGGLPAAALYRFANTADAMWGYKGRYGRYYLTWFGKWTARVDDALSWIPARISALLICLVSARFHFSKIRIEASKTTSPNGGWPMGAMAYALNIKLSKPDVYTLNPKGHEASVASLEQSCRIATHIFYLVWFLVFIGLTVEFWK